MADVHGFGGGVPLGMPSTVEVKDIRLIPVASVTFMKGGCDRPQCELRAEVVDVANGVVWLVPMSLPFAVKLVSQLGGVIEQLTQTKPEGN